MDGYYRAVKRSTFSRGFLSAFSDFFFGVALFSKFVYDFDEIKRGCKVALFTLKNENCVSEYMPKKIIQKINFSYEKSRSPSR